MNALFQQTSTFLWEIASWILFLSFLVSTVWKHWISFPEASGAFLQKNTVASGKRPQEIVFSSWNIYSAAILIPCRLASFFIDVVSTFTLMIKSDIWTSTILCWKFCGTAVRHNLQQPAAIRPICCHDSDQSLPKILHTLRTQKLFHHMKCFIKGLQPRSLTNSCPVELIKAKQGNMCTSPTALEWSYYIWTTAHLYLRAESITANIDPYLTFVWCI